MTPNDIEVLIHCYCRTGVHPRIDAPAVEECIKDFLSNELIEKVADNEYRTTLRGVSHITQLCDLKLPILKWTNEQGEIIQVD